MKAFADMLSFVGEFTEICDHLKGGRTPVTVTGTTGSQRSHFVYSVSSALDKKCLVIASDETEAYKLYLDLSYFFGDNVLLFKTKEYVFYDVDSSSRRGETDRIRTLSAIDDAKVNCLRMTTLKLCHSLRSDVEDLRCSYCVNVGIAIESINHNLVLRHRR